MRVFGFAQRSTSRFSAVMWVVAPGAACLLALGAAQPTGAQASFTGLGDLPGGVFSSYAEDVSGDGTTVVGKSFWCGSFEPGEPLPTCGSPWEEAFRWKNDGVCNLDPAGENPCLIALGDLDGGQTFSRALGVSYDGSVVVGESRSDGGVPGENTMEGFRWLESTRTMEGLGFLGSPFPRESEARAVSADGSLIVGESSRGIAFYWTAEQGMLSLPLNVGAATDALAVSPDGRVIVGTHERPSGTSPHPARWTAQTVDPPGGYSLLELSHASSAEAFGVNADGSVVVGRDQTPQGNQACVWTDGAVTHLGDLSGGLFWSIAHDVSADGTKVVGQSHTGLGWRAFLWEPATGMRDLQIVLETEYGLGLDLSDWSLQAATGISDDGRVIVGAGVSPSGTQAWIVELEPAVTDSDGDGVPDEEDVCPGHDDNLDSDGDLVPDGCDPCPLDADNDADGDGVCGDADVCPGGDDTLDDDQDGTPDFCDVCPADPENDADGDGICESDDNCPLTANSSQIDSDLDGLGDACDPDDDNDGVADVDDNCPFDANPEQVDTDGDGAGNVCDTDDDGDGVLDADDQCLETTPGDTVDASGCSIADLAPCTHPVGGDKWKNHGAYVSSVARTSERFVADGLITEAEKDAIVSSAGDSACGAKIK